MKRLLTTLSLCLAAAMPRPAVAMDRDVRSVLVGGGYGLIGGTVLGLASYPLTRDARSIFIGSSVGLFLGIAVGTYFAFDRDNPDNPLRSQLDPALTVPPDTGPNARPDLAMAAPQGIKPGQKSGPPAWLEVKFPVARF